MLEQHASENWGAWLITIWVQACTVRVRASVYAFGEGIILSFNNEIAPFFLSIEFPMKSKLAVSYWITFDFYRV